MSLTVMGPCLLLSQSSAIASSSTPPPSPLRLTLADSRESHHWLSKVHKNLASTVDVFPQAQFQKFSSSVKLSLHLSSSLPLLPLSPSSSFGSLLLFFSSSLSSPHPSLFSFLPFSLSLSFSFPSHQLLPVPVANLNECDSRDQYLHHTVHMHGGHVGEGCHPGL